MIHINKTKSATIVLLLFLTLVPASAMKASCPTRPITDILSVFPSTPPEIDGIMEAGEWEDAAQYHLENGSLRVLNDAVSLYILLDVVDDTVDDSTTGGEDWGGDVRPTFGDAFSIAVDVGNDKTISRSDLNFRIMPETLLLGVENLLSEDPSPLEVAHSSLGVGFGESIDSRVPHRYWEIALSLKEIHNILDNVVRIGVMIYSPNPSILSQSPENFYSDFANLIEVTLATDEIDLLVLADESFIDAVKPLKEHKDGTGIKTYVHSWQSLNKTMYGRDEPERLKWAIHSYNFFCNAKYVMLVGDCDKLPVRYVKGYNSEWGVNYLASDLYYADLYDSFSFFEDWDWDQDGVFGELNYSGGTDIAQVNLDKIDMQPDVSVGRIPASTVAEVETYVDKVINYELSTTASDWFKGALYIVDGGSGAFGDPAKKDAIDQYLTGFNITKMYLDNSPWNTMEFETRAAQINSVLNSGVGFVNVMGHGNTLFWQDWYDSYRIQIAFASNTSCYYPYPVKDVSDLGDFNGDGMEDIVIFVGNATEVFEGEVYVALSSGSDFGLVQMWHDNFTSGEEVPAVGDFNGDGKDDIILFHRGSSGDSNLGDVYVALSNGSSFEDATLWHDYFCVGQEEPRIGDFDGDGKDDIVTFVRSTKNEPGRGDVFVALSNGTAFGQGQEWHDYFCLGSEIPETGDFNGDGKDDIITFIRSTKSGSGAGDVYVSLSNGTEFGQSETWHDYFSLGSEFPAVGDFDGNGKDDIVTFVRDSSAQPRQGDVYVALSNGTRFEAVKAHDRFASDGGQPRTGDVNGDGYDDFVAFENVSSGIFGEVTVSRSFPSNNEDKLPVIFAVSCYTGRFIFGRDLYQDENGTEWAGGSSERPVPNSLQPAKYDRESLAENFLVKSDVGAVGYIGCTDPFEYGGEDLDKYFFEAYNASSKPATLGGLWRTAVDKFVQNKAKVVAMYYYAFIHAHKVMLFGDPSLRVGGLPFQVASIPLGELSYPVFFRSNSLITNWQFREPQEDLAFRVQGLEDTPTGFTNLTIPKSLLVPIEKDPVLLDGTPIPSQTTSNLTHSFVYFRYSHSTHEIVIRGDSEPPSIDVQAPSNGTAAQDGLTLNVLASDPNNVAWVKFSIRQSDGTAIDPAYEEMPASHANGDSWTLFFDTLKLDDGYYLFLTNASDSLGNEASKTVDFSIQNWACVELLPASQNNKAGRTMPIKFSLRVTEAVDPAKPFVYNEELTVLVRRKVTGEVLQTSTYGDTSTDYRIDPLSELYITNFKTLKTPLTYVVEIYRKDMLLDSFEFNTIK
jgi:hypothetical protein